MLAMVLVLAVVDIGDATERLVLGGSGADWNESAVVFSALDVLEGGVLAPLQADTTENLLPRVVELGGSAQTSVTTAAARSNEILGDLIDDDFKTGWRVYTNTNGAELRIDLGAVFVLQRIHMEPGVVGRVDRSLRGYELLVNDGDSLNFVGNEPIFSLIAKDRSNGAVEFDVRFPPQPVRFLILRSTGERSFQMGDMQVFGVGVTPFAHYTSQVFDLGQPANFGPVEIYSTIDGAAQLLFSTRSGEVQDDSLYFEQTGIPGKFKEVTRDQFDRSLDPSYAGEVRANDRDWSAWSPPYAESIGGLNSPDNRRFVQFDVRFISNGLTAKASIDSVVVNYSVPPLAASVIAEITPGRAELGERNEFEYHLRSVFSGGERGFDGVVIFTPFAAEATAVEVDGVPVFFTQEAGDTRLRVGFPDNRVEADGQRVMVRFNTLVTVSGTEFRGEVSDSQSDAFPQRLVSGDADEAVDSNTLVVSGQILDDLFANVAFSSAVFSPNGDGRNDRLEINYTLLKATSAVDVRVVAYNLAGQPVRELYDARDLTGPNTVFWDGRNAGGELVPPGIYVVKLSADSDSGGDAKIEIIAVAY